MKKVYLVISFVLVMVIPAVIVSILSSDFTMIQKNEESPSGDDMTEISLRVMTDNDVILMDLDDYVTGVVLGEMPADFETEALKAQAVAARTYTVCRMMRGSKHHEADVCMNASCCQAFVLQSAFAGSENELSKVCNAVEETKGEILTYNGLPIEATYFSSAGGKTEEALAVWGSDVPYLASVDSPEGYVHENTYVMTFEEFYEKLGLEYLGVPMVDTTSTNGGGVEFMYVNGYAYSGVQVRKLLKLASTNFDVTVSERNVTINTKGNGHRVGMSQYGAEAMAVEGSKYQDILAHYYQGTKLETYTPEQLQAVFDKV